MIRTTLGAVALLFAFPLYGAATAQSPPQQGFPAVPPVAAPVDGAYKTDHGKMNLMQVGADVEGTYAHGSITGRMQGDVLEGWWAQQTSPQRCDTPRMETHHWGRVRFRFDAERKMFLGRFGYCETGPSSPWNGTRNSPGA